MKPLRIISSILLIYIFSSCEKEKYGFIPFEAAHQVEACGTENPLLKPWLNKLILESMDDENFIEMIWVKEDNHEDIFVVKYSLTSVAYYFFNCDGIRIYPSNLSITRSISGSVNDTSLLYIAEKIKH